MKLREFIGVFEQSERLRIVKDGKEIYTGYKALMEHAELERSWMQRLSGFARCRK